MSATSVWTLSTQVSTIYSSTAASSSSVIANQCSPQDPSVWFQHAPCVETCFQTENASGYRTGAGSCDILNISKTLLGCLRKACNLDASGVKLSVAQIAIDGLAGNCCNKYDWTLVKSSSTTNVFASSTLLETVSTTNMTPYPTTVVTAVQNGSIITVPAPTVTSSRPFNIIESGATKTFPFIVLYGLLSF
ncbi:hypothetical protein HDU79_010305 [Rhizoclosmatium sp. JEL0117]|nr:hypothetical protein HDU79_010305 [Rhizoclosmatium sp. JEL0117]